MQLQQAQRRADHALERHKVILGRTSSRSGDELSHIPRPTYQDIHSLEAMIEYHQACLDVCRLKKQILEKKSRCPVSTKRKTSTSELQKATLRSGRVRSIVKVNLLCFRMRVIFRSACLKMTIQNFIWVY